MDTRGSVFVLSGVASCVATWYLPLAFSGKVGQCPFDCDPTYVTPLAVLVASTVAMFLLSFLTAAVSLVFPKFTYVSWALFGLGVAAVVAWSAVSGGAPGVNVS
jgi:hypothetical protein